MALFGFHVGVHRLHVVELLEFLDHLVDSLPLIGRNVLEVAGIAVDLCPDNLEPLVFEVFLYLSEAFRVAVNGN